MLASELSHVHSLAFAPQPGWSRESFETLLNQESVWLFVDKEKRGFLLTRGAADEMEILTLAVCPEYQRRGIARTLLEQAIEQARSLGIRQIFLEVDQHNLAAVQCYQHWGFTVISIRPGYYAHPEGRRDAWVMQRLL